MKNITLPISVLVKNQTRTFEKRFENSGGEYMIRAFVRFGDQCGNGHNTFSITGVLSKKNHRGIFREECGGCIHDEIAKYFPRLQPLLKWHLVSTDGPMHYLSNTIHLAGDRDCWDGRKGEVRSWAYGIELANGKPLRTYDFASDGRVYSETKDRAEKMVEQFEGAKIIKIPSLIHDGKERELGSARRAAVWPDATDEQLSAEPEVLRQALLDRLPELMEAFKFIVTSLEFKY